jgi:hypothetical protein
MLNTTTTIAKLPPTKAMATGVLHVGFATWSMHNTQSIRRQMSIAGQVVFSVKTRSETIQKQP